jgi:hypothetical protein
MPDGSCSSKSIGCAVILADSKSAAAQPLFPLPPPSKPDEPRGAAIIGLPALPAKLQGIDSQIAKLGKWCSHDHQSCQSCG